MRPARHARRCRNKKSALFRRRGKPRRQVDLPSSDDDDEDIVEIGGGPADDESTIA